MANILAKENETLSERKAAIQHFASVIYKIIIFGALLVVVLALPLAFVVPVIAKPLAEGAQSWHPRPLRSHQVSPKWPRFPLKRHQALPKQSAQLKNCYKLLRLTSEKARDVAQRARVLRFRPLRKARML